MQQGDSRGCGIAKRHTIKEYPKIQQQGESAKESVCRKKRVNVRVREQGAHA